MIKKLFYVEQSKNVQIKKFAKKLVRNTLKFYYKYYIILLNKKSWITEEGILVIGLKEFLLNQNSLDL